MILCKFQRGDAIFMKTNFMKIKKLLVDAKKYFCCLLFVVLVSLENVGKKLITLKYKIDIVFNLAFVINLH